MSNEEKTVEQLMEEAAKSLLNDVLTAKGAELKEKADVFKVVTLYFQAVGKLKKKSDDDYDEDEPTMRGLAESFGNGSVRGGEESDG